MPSSFQVGSRVYSAQLGVGEVLAVEGYGDKERLTIRFESAGVRQVLSRHFVLEPYDNELHGPAARVPAPPEAPPSGAAGADPVPPAGQERAQAAAPAGAPRAAGRPAAAAPEASAADSIKEALREVLREELGAPEVRMLDRWKGGALILRPGRPGLKEKEVPIDAIFHKVVMIRDRLRVLEQKINSHPGLADADKVEMQQYITRVHGSLTTFNILFADRDDAFTGQAGSED